MIPHGKSLLPVDQKDILHIYDPNNIFIFVLIHRNPGKHIPGIDLHQLVIRPVDIRQSHIDPGDHDLLHRRIGKIKDIVDHLLFIPLWLFFCFEKIPYKFFGKLAGYTQVRELGNIEAPVILTNTLSVGAGMQGVIKYTINQPGNERENSVNAVVGETNDGRLNAIRKMSVTPDMVIQAIKNAHGGKVEQGNVGAGTGTICFGFKGGIGTSSRVLPESLGGYTIGVITQTNYGGVLEIDGVQIGQLLEKHDFINHVKKNENVDGSCMMVVITDAPLDSRNLERVAKRAMLGLAKTGGIAANGSGDYVIALSVAPENLIPDKAKKLTTTVLSNNEMSSIFCATIEATAEALWNSLFMAESMTGRDGYHVDCLPVDRVVELLKSR